MRLIDADKLMLHLNDYALQEAPISDLESRDAYDAVQNCMKAVEEQPTAYDVEKVVEQLEKMNVGKEKCRSCKYDGICEEYRNNNPAAETDEELCAQVAQILAIDIVKVGGVNDI